MKIHLFVAPLALGLFAASVTSSAHAHDETKHSTVKVVRPVAAATGKTLVLSLAGLHCEGCAASVTRHLSKVPGVARVVSVSAEQQKAVVQYGKTAPSAVALKAAVKEAGYQCVRLDNKAK